MDIALKIKLEEFEQELQEAYELALTHGDESTKDMKVFLNIKEKTLAIKHNAQNCHKALEAAKQQWNVEDFENVYNQELQKNKNFQAKKTNEYKEFQRSLNEIKASFEQKFNDHTGTSEASNRIEGEDFIMETQLNIIDPLTKQQMKNPVKNKFCGHNYEKNSILEAIVINKRLRCPVAGCGNNKFVQKDHLVDNIELKGKISEIVAAAEDDDLF